ncbi:uncharacterized protein LOC143133844 [Alosa pseudoharengus]|uniref:uncharacterized protein LOC143133844 n=1 Tax=Alosa pseudoharengus TaxID=34774 RepID=UPI003F88AC09
MTGTQVLLVSLLLSPYVLFSANSRHVPASADAPMSIRVLRSLKEKYKDLLRTIETERRTDGSTEVETTFVYACVGLEDEMKNMKVDVEKHKAKNNELEVENLHLKKKLRDEVASNRQTGYETALRIAEMQLKLTGWIDQMGFKTIKISKLTLEAFSKYVEFKDLEIKIKKAKDSKTISEFQTQLEKKKKELSVAEQELIAAGGSTDLVKQVISLQDKIHELESSEADEDVLEQIAELKSQLEKKQEELKSKGGSDESSALIPEIVASQDDILKIYIKMQTLTDQSKSKLTELETQLKEKNRQLNRLRESSDSSASADIAKLEKEVRKLEGKMEDERRDKASTIKGLEKALKEKKDLLQGKIKDLQDDHNTDYDLILKILTQQLRLEEAQSASCSGQPDTDHLLAGVQRRLAAKEEEIQSLEGQNKRLQKQLEEKSEQFSGLSNKIKAAQKELKEKSELLAATEEEKSKQKLKLQEKMEENAKLKISITVLEKSKAETEDSCASLKERYTDLKTKFEEDMTQIEGVPKLIIKMNMLNSEIETLKREIDRESGDKKELKRRLENKKKELEEAEKDLGNRSPSSKAIKELVAVIRERVKEEPENIQDYLKQISDLEKELDERIAALGDKEAENVQAMIKMMALQDEVTQMKSKLSKVKKDTSQRIAEKESELERKRQEINQMKAADCERSEKRKEEIATLEREARELEAQLKRLKDSAQRDIAALEKRLKERERDLKANTEKLQSVDEKNGELLAKTIKMQDEMNALMNGEKDLKQRTADEISDLKSQLQVKEQVITTLKAANKDLMSSAEEAKECAVLKTRNEDLQRELGKKDKDLSKMQKERDEALSSQKEAEDDLKKLKQTSAALENEKNNLQDSLNIKEKENQSLKDKVEDFEKMKKKDEENAVHIAQPAIDPDTAHPKLQLSHSNSEMKLLETALNVPEGPARYNRVIGALASTGFDKGRQYWEVGVAGKPCYTLGVAGETAPREGAITFDPKNQYWTLMLTRTDILSTAQRKKTKLREVGQAKPRKIGVLIDFKKKEIAFYDAGAKALLHTFSNIEVKSKLFPFMSTCEDTEEGSPPMVFNAVASVDWLKS